MRILRLTAYYHPEKVSSTHLFDDLEKALLDEGHEIIILTPTPSRNIDKQTIKNYKKKIKRNEFLFDNKLKIIRFKLFPEPKHYLLRAFRYSLSIIKQYIISRKIHNVDLILVDSTPPIQGIIGAKLKNKKKIPMIYMLQDVFPDSLLNTGLIKKKKLVWKIGRFIEDYIYKNSDKIITISDDFHKNLVEKNVREDKISVIENWINIDKVKFISRDNNYIFDMYNIDKGKFIVSYCGNLGLTQNLEMVINAAKMFEECKDILFLFIGDGANKKNLIEKAKGKANILFLPFQPQQNISEVYSVGNVGLIISKVGIGSNSIPSKIFSMMSASQPILASFDLNSNLARIIKTSDSGYCVEPNNLTALVEMIKHIYKNKDELLFLGGNGRLYLQKKYSKSKSVNEYLNVIQKVTIKK